MQKQSPQLVESYKAGMFIAAQGGLLLLTCTPSHKAHTYLLQSLPK